MRLSIRLLGLELLAIEASTDAEAVEYDVDRELSGGTTASYPVGFGVNVTPREDEGVDYQ